MLTPHVTSFPLLRRWAGEPKIDGWVSWGTIRLPGSVSEGRPLTICVAQNPIKDYDDQRSDCTHGEVGCL